MKRILFSLLLSLSVTAFANQHVMTSGGSTKLSIDVPPASGQKASMIDLLLVIDDSGSMYEHQVNLAGKLPPLIGKLAAMGADFHVGVMTTTMSTSGTGVGNKPGNGELVNGFVESSDPSFVSKIEGNIKVGTNGSGMEMMFDPLVAGLSEPMLGTKNAGFLRPSAPLAVVFITDGEDQSATNSPQATAQFLAQLKGSAGIKTIAGFIPSIDTTCNRSGEAPPARIEAFLSATAGTMANLCDPNLNDMIADSIATMITSPNPNPQPASVYDRVIELPSKAVLSSIKVVYDHQELAFGDVWSGWVFDSNKNAVIIGDGVALGTKPWLTTIEIEYSIANWP